MDEAADRLRRDGRRRLMAGVLDLAAFNDLYAYLCEKATPQWFGPIPGP